MLGVDVIVCVGVKVNVGEGRLISDAEIVVGVNVFVGNFACVRAMEV